MLKRVPLQLGSVDRACFDLPTAPDRSNGSIRVQERLLKSGKLFVLITSSVSWRKVYPTRF